LYEFTETKGSHNDSNGHGGMGRSLPNGNAFLFPFSIFNLCFVLDDTSLRKLRSQNNGRAEEPPAMSKEELKDNKVKKRQLKAAKELEDLKQDNAGRYEADRTAIRRKIQAFLSRNDEITAE